MNFIFFGGEATHICHVHKVDRYDEYIKSTGQEAENYNECKTVLILSLSNLQNVMSFPCFYTMYVRQAVLKAFCKDVCSSCLHLAKRQQSKKKKAFSSYSSITINIGSVHSNTDLICIRHEHNHIFSPLKLGGADNIASVIVLCPTLVT